ncbi:MAG: Crp/Fnr family transcriptional regulator [Clostridiales bacterium]|nr:Crp/Fnr family transcriptional regulator [Clostridiales bacterium]
MKVNLTILKKCSLFAGILEKDLLILLPHLNAEKRVMEKGAVVFNVGDRPEHVGVVLSGSVNVVHEDYWGNRTILSVVQSGGIFAESFSYAEAKSLPVSVVAREDSEILLLDCTRILTTCSSSCAFHTALIRNLMKILANKNIMLTRKMEHITKKTTRDKVLSYLSECAVSAGRDTFDIPFNRQELADYLSVDRSALSNSLCKMRDEVLIEFYKNSFRLLET